jgi:hypothetical protein
MTIAVVLKAPAQTMTGSFGPTVFASNTHGGGTGANLKFKVIPRPHRRAGSR